MIFLVLLLLQGPEEELVSKARSLIEQGRGIEALRALENAAEQFPKSARVQHELGLLFALGGRMDEARAAFARAVELAPENVTFSLDYGEVLYRSGESEAALPYLEKAAGYEDHIEARLLLAACYETLGRKEESIATLESYVSAKPEQKDTRVLLGDKLEEAKRFDEALEVYRKGLALDGTDATLLRRAGELLARDRDTYSEAETYARKAVEAAPEMLEARLLLARVLSRTARNDEALAVLETARDAHPEASQVHYNLSQVYQRAGRTEDAKAAAARFQELSRKEKEAAEREARVASTYKRAVDLLQQGKMLEAEPVFRSVLDIDPDHAQTRSMLAKIAFSKRDVSGAERLIREAIEGDETVAEYHYLLALFRARAGNPAGAEAPLRRALELDPGFPDGWSLLGSILLDSGRAEGAVECFSRAAALEPENAATQLNLASAYAALGRAEDEAAAMERYRELNRR